MCVRNKGSIISSRLFGPIEFPNLGVKMSWFVESIVYFKIKKLAVFVIIRCWDFVAARGRILPFATSFRPADPCHLSFGNCILFFQKESGSKLGTTCRAEVMNARSSASVYLWIVYCIRFSIAVFPSFLGAKEARREGIWTNIWNVICLQNWKALCQCINLQSQYGYLWRLLVKLKLLLVSVSAPCTSVGVHSVMVFCSNK
jgi:hypothetical protein